LPSVGPRLNRVAANLSRRLELGAVPDDWTDRPGSNWV